MSYAIGSLVQARGREWVVLPESTEELLLLRPLGGSENEITGIFLPLEPVSPARFGLPNSKDVGDYRSCRLLRDALRLGFRSNAGPFRSFGSIAVEPRPYQLVPLLMALKLDPVRILIADDVGIGKTVEACLIARELLDRGEVNRIAVLCPPHLAEQWQKELMDKFHIQAELVLPSTARRLEKPCGLGESLFDFYPFVVVSMDFIKSDRRRDEFIRSCPEFVIVDEAHTCSYSNEGRGGRKQRFELIKGISSNPDRHLILVTATPHSGKENEFRSLLSLLDDRFTSLPDDLNGLANKEHRRELSAHFIQRRRADIKRYLDADTLFPEREENEESYKLSPAYRQFLEDVISYARERVRNINDTQFCQRIRWWSALALLRSISSSPAAAIATLRSRAACSSAESMEEVEIIGRKSVMDLVENDATGEFLDMAPGAFNDEDREDIRNQRWLNKLIQQAESLSENEDIKVLNAISLIKGLISDGYNPIIFCRFIPTAEYVAGKLRESLRGVEIDYVTGMLPPEEREDRVIKLANADKRVLVCTDCLSEGINLQEYFDAVMHYDLAWNPTRHEQREGRVDRYGQPNKNVRVLTYYGVDNHIDGLVLNVLIRKHKTIRSSLGISVPVPANAENVVDAIFEWMLLKDDWNKREKVEQIPLFEEFVGPQKKDLDLQWEAAANREKRSRTLYAQEAIKVDEVANELRVMQDAIGASVDVEIFMHEALTLNGGIVSHDNGKLAIDLSQAPIAVKEISLEQPKFTAGFTLPVKKGELYLYRNHPIVESLANYVMEIALESSGEGVAKRCGVIKTKQVSKRTTLVLVRFRYHIITNQQGKETPLLAEECKLLAFEGPPENAIWLDEVQAEVVFNSKPDVNTPPEVARDFIAKVINSYEILLPHLEQIASEKGQALLEAHRRVRMSTRQKGVRYRVEPNLPPDVLGIYVYLPIL